MTWFSQKNFTGGHEQGISAQVQVPADADLFDGHFPGDPILPGVAQVALVVELLEAALEHSVSLQSVSRVRFKKIIQPDETIDVQIAPKGKDGLTYGFTLASGPDRVCSGTMTVTDQYEH